MSRFSFLQDLFLSLLDRQPESSAREDSRSLVDLCEALLTGRGEVSGNQIAYTILDRIETADAAERREFFETLLTRFDIDAQAAVWAASAYASEGTPETWRQLLATTEPRRQELLRRINRVPNATGRLVALRAELLLLLAENPDLVRIDIDFEHLFGSWFNRGFLVMRQIDWNTPASILETIIEYEAVHAINDWADLRSRLEPSDRRCFAFFHPAMPDDPLIFVEVALTRSLPSSIQHILTAQRTRLNAAEADTAVFYSISNCQAGLKGVSFGNFLIKQVASELASQFPNLKTFRTLSPVPSLMHWVRDLVSGRQQVPAEWRAAVEVASAMIESDTVSSVDEPDLDALRRLAAHYLVNVRRQDQEPHDPVARFHLGNGASLSEIVAAADLSPKGRKQSAGIMVSYLYDLDAIERNHEAYALERVVTTSRDVDNLLASVPEKPNRKKIAHG